MLHGDWRNHAGEAASPSGERRPPSRFGFNVLEWRTQATSNTTIHSCSFSPLFFNFHLFLFFLSSSCFQPIFLHVAFHSTLFFVIRVLFFFLSSHISSLELRGWISIACCRFCTVWRCLRVLIFYLHIHCQTAYVTSLYNIKIVNHIMCHYMLADVL